MNIADLKKAMEKLEFADEECKIGYMHYVGAGKSEFVEFDKVEVTLDTVILMREE